MSEQAQPVPSPELPPTPDAGLDAAQVRLWDAVREALRGSHQDYTRGPVGRAVLLLAIPMVLEMALESVFAVVDVFFVARLGAHAVAAVGLTEALLALVYALGMGLGMGATAVVARRIGEHDADGAARAAVQAAALAIGISIVLGVTGVLAAPRLLALMGASPEVIAIGQGYTRVMLGGEVSVIVLFVVNASLRGAGDAATAMRVLWLGNAINLVLDPLLIFGIGPFPELGVTGAAVATTTGRTVAALWAISRLLRPVGHLVVRREHLRLEPAVLGTIARISANGSFQALVGTASWIGLTRIVAGFGSAALAGYTIALRIVVFALMPAWGLSNAAATMVGQSLGARDPRRAEQAVWIAGFYTMLFLGVIGLVFFIWAEELVRLFTPDPAVLGHAASALRIIAAGFLFYAYGMVLTQAFNGAGDTLTPTLLNIAVFWAFEIPLAYVLAVRLEMGPRGVFVAVAVAFSTLAVVSGVVFRRGRWKETRV